MKTPHVAPSQLKGTKAWEYLVRFGFGGAVTVATGIVAKIFGPLVAGLFLAFPAILPASLTLVKQHDGRAKAVDDARGGRLGSVGLLAFAIFVVLAAEHLGAPLVLLAAAAVWLLVDAVLWFLLYGRSS